MRPLIRYVGLAALTSGLFGTAMCADVFDTRRADRAAGTVGQETFLVVCERVNVGESPADFEFRAGRPFCAGESASADTLGPKVHALVVRRAGVIDALDHAIPRDLYDPMDRLLVQLVPLYGTDDGRDAGTVRLLDGGRAPAEPLLPATTRSVANLLTTLGGDDAATAALARFASHQGYRPPRTALGLTRNLLAYPRLGALLDAMLALVREPGAGQPAGAANGEFNALLDTLRGELATTTRATPDPTGTTLDALTDLVFRADPALGTGRERLVVRRDADGLARVALGADGRVPAPFRDDDGDGLADRAALPGDRDPLRFLDATGSALTVPSPFAANEAPDGPRDAHGRALVAPDGAPMYQYADLDQTLLGALLRDARPLVDPEHHALLRLLSGASVLLGARGPASRDYDLRHPCAGSSEPRCAVPPVTYNRFDTATAAPLLDLVHGLGVALTSQDLDDVLSLFERLLATNEGAVARAVAAMLRINDVARATPAATMDPRSNVWDDIVEVAGRIAQQPGLLESVLDAVADPQTQRLGQRFADFASHRDRIEPVWTTARQNDSLAGRTLTQTVDRARSDTQNTAGGADDNRSVLQRFLHIAHDLNGVRICNREGAYIRLTSVLRWPVTGGYTACELIQIDNAIQLYLGSIDGTARIELRDGTLPAFLARAAPGIANNLLETLTGITGLSTSPTPQAMDRMVMQPDAVRTDAIRALLDPIRTRDGIDIRTVHPATIFTTELNEFYAAIRPLVHAFLSHGDAAAQTFADLLSALHLHWASVQAGQYQRTDPRGPLYSTMDGAVTYEPILIEAFGGDLIAAGGDLLRAASSMTFPGGRTGRDVLAQMARLVLDPTALRALAYRDGRTSTVRSDGATPVAHPALYYLLADAFNAMDASFAANPARADDWAEARGHLVDTFLSVDGGGTPGARFRDRAFPVVARLLVRWLRDRAASHRAAGDLEVWGRGLAARAGDTVSAPTFAAVTDLVLALHADVPTRAAVADLLGYLLDDAGDTAENPLGTTLTSMGDLLQILRDDGDIDPLLAALAPAFQRARPTAGGTLREEAVPVALRFLDRANGYDTERSLLRVLANMATRSPAPLLADEPLVVLGDAIAETHRAQPGAGGPLAREDFREVFHQVADFLTDGSRGMEQFYYIVNHRRLP